MVRGREGGKAMTRVEYGKPRSENRIERLRSSKTYMHIDLSIQEERQQHIHVLAYPVWKAALNIDTLAPQASACRHRIKRSPWQ